MENENKKGIIAAVIDGFKESTHATHEANKENMAFVKTASKAMHQRAVAPYPGTEDIRAAKGLKAKVRAILKNMREGCKRASEREKAFRAQAVSLEGYQTILSEMRTNMQGLIDMIDCGV
ncbi:MAG: hypothetical protein FWE84_00205 [Firmicutes bacterium]|nr:hypothetical protein [Bacillota bacterium]